MSMSPERRRRDTFSMSAQVGRSSRTMRRYWNQSPLRFVGFSGVPSPRFLPAEDSSWHGKPPLMMSTGSRLCFPHCLTSVNLDTSSQCFFSTFRTNSSRSTCQTVLIPAQLKPRSIPPTPENRLPCVRFVDAALCRHPVVANCACVSDI